MQVATELVVGFDKSFVTKELLVRHQKLWADWLDGFISLPINLPGFGMFQAQSDMSPPLAARCVTYLTFLSCDLCCNSGTGSFSGVPRACAQPCEVCFLHVFAHLHLVGNSTVSPWLERCVNSQTG